MKRLVHIAVWAAIAGFVCFYGWLLVTGRGQEFGFPGWLVLLWFPALLLVPAWGTVLTVWTLRDVGVRIPRRLIGDIPILVFEGTALAVAGTIIALLMAADLRLPSEDQFGVLLLLGLLFVGWWGFQFLGRVQRVISGLPALLDSDDDEEAEGGGVVDGWTAHPMPWRGGASRPDKSPDDVA